MTNPVSRLMWTATLGCALTIGFVSVPGSVDPSASGHVTADATPHRTSFAYNSTQTPGPALAPSKTELVDKYCVRCHNARTRAGDLVLEAMKLDEVGANAETWEKVVRKLRTGAMPPAGLPRPDPEASKAFVATVEGALDRLAASRPSPGRPPIHRLNRTEYANAVRDLLDIEVDARALLPVDDSGYGFDNIADVLSVSPGILERYMTAASKISRPAVGDGRTRSAIQT